jgi:hypothetical protein
VWDVSKWFRIGYSTGFSEHSIGRPHSAKEGLLGRDNVVCIVTRYRLVGPEFVSRCGQDFLHPSRSALGHPNTVRWVLYFFPGVKAAGSWC